MACKQFFVVTEWLQGSALYKGAVISPAVSNVVTDTNYCKSRANMTFLAVKKKIRSNALLDIQWARGVHRLFSFPILTPFCLNR